MVDPWASGGPSNGVWADLRAPGAKSRSFAELVAALNRLNALESALATAIAQARVPVQEVRTLLRARTPSEAETASAFQFMREVFAQVGIPLSIEAVRRFTLTFGVDASPYSRLLSCEVPRKTCRFVSESIARFLGTDFGVPADVDEAACRNEGAPRCVFEAALDPIATVARALDAPDGRLFEALAAGTPPNGAAEDLGFAEDERDYRMESLVGYGLVAADGRLLPNGEALARAGPGPVEERFEPPWRVVSRLAGAIANAASAAEALVEVAPRVPPGDVGPDAETSALAAECHSFAELLARASKGRSWG